MEAIHIAMSVDKRFLIPASVAIRSISLHAMTTHVIHVFHDDLDEADMKKLRSVVGNDTSLEFIECQVSDLPAHHLPSYLSKTSLFRLFVGTLLPEKLSRVIYIDADTLIRRPLGDLWNLDLHGNTVAAIQDPVLPWIGAPMGPPWRAMQIDPHARYFNSGVMRIDLHRWREERIGESSLRILETHRVSFGDQCALNCVLIGRVEYISPQWNLQSGFFWPERSLAETYEPPSDLEQAISNPSIVHFNSSPLGRPWQNPCKNPFCHEWREIAKGTYLAEWHPSRRLLMPALVATVEVSKKMATRMLGPVYK